MEQSGPYMDCTLTNIKKKPEVAAGIKEQEMQKWPPTHPT